MSFTESDPLPNEAREQLKAHGDQLMRQLNAMRESEAERIEIEPLDADAQLALRQHGSNLLADLEAQRDQLTAAAPVRKSSFPWVAVAACFVGVIVCTSVLDTPEPEQKITVQEDLEPEPEPEPELNPEFFTPSVSVPEPSTGLLAVAGTMLLLKRRRV